MAHTKFRPSYPDGLKQAIIALSFFRARHNRKLLYAKAKGKNAQKTISGYVPHKKLAKQYIAAARACGWRGSVWEAIQKY